MDRELTPKQQTSEAIRQAEAILIMTGQRPSIDQVASTIALEAILRKYGKKVTAVISDEYPAGARFLHGDLVQRSMAGIRDFIMEVDLSHAEVDKLKYTIDNGKLNVHITPFAGSFSPRDVSYTYGEYQFDLVIVLGVPSMGRIDKVYAQNEETLRSIPIVNIDFHRINEQYGAINLLETSAASLAEILIALSESLQSGLIDESIATTMLTGLFAATDRFTANHTTAKSMTVAAQMVAMGADQQKVVRNLYKADKSDKPDKGDKKQNPNQSAKRDQAPQAAKDEPSRQQRNNTPSDPMTPSLAPAQVAEPIATQAAVIAEATQPERVEPEPAVVAEPQPDPVAEVQAAPPVSIVQPAAEMPVAAEPTPPEISVPDELEPVMEELLPPQHIELSEPDSGSRAGMPEPLINDVQPSPASKPQVMTTKQNPINNPVFAQRLDEFEY